jgi:hypothetical protein
MYTAAVSIQRRISRMARQAMGGSNAATSCIRPKAPCLGA